MSCIISKERKGFYPRAARKLAQIAGTEGVFLDIGGGLRILQDRGDIYDPYMAQEIGSILHSTRYKILDPVTTYQPHLTGDILNLPFADSSVGAIWCNSVLEHVTEPQRAAQEMYRILKKGGGIFIYAPFLFRYHPSPGYYQDFYRFTEDGVKYLTRDFTQVIIIELGGRFETVGTLIPSFAGTMAKYLGRIADSIINKRHRKDTKGFACFCIK